MRIDPGQRRLLQTILKERRYIKGGRAKRVYDRTATQVGLVESQLKELDYGDADSKNWRQERASVYGPQWAKTGGPLNTKASARRFRQEFQQHYQPGEKSYEVAAQIQRPREDLRGRYQEEAGKAAAILRGLDVPRGGSQHPSSKGGRAAASREPQAAVAPEVGTSGMVQQLAASLARPQRPAASAPAAPAFSAQATMAGAPIPSQPRQPRSSGVESRLAEALSTQGTDLPATQQPEQAKQAKPGKGARGRGAGGKGVERKPGALAEMFHDPGVNLDSGRKASPIGGHGSHVHAAFNSPKALLAAARLAKRYGLVVKENPKFDKVDPVHTQGSFHYQRFKKRPGLGRAIDVSGGTAAKLLAYNRELARRYG